MRLYIEDLVLIKAIRALRHRIEWQLRCHTRYLIVFQNCKAVASSCLLMLHTHTSNRSRNFESRQIARKSELAHHSSIFSTMPIGRRILDIFKEHHFATFCTYSAFSSSTFPVWDDFQYSYGVRFQILHGSNSGFGYPNNHVFEQCPVPIDLDKRRSTVVTNREKYS
ncbi:hypothetical protein TNCV_4135191 [Trichonephila clavipes]|nr:hypothetical protein TNCV_4135191 [Trichonephila clavipes]